MRTLAIGDIHGFSGALETLLGVLNPDKDQLIFLGDYIDRGPDSRGVLERLIELSQNPNHVFLRGNHDDWMLRAREPKNAGSNRGSDWAWAAKKRCVRMAPVRLVRRCSISCPNLTGGFWKKRFFVLKAMTTFLRTHPFLPRRWNTTSHTG